MDVTCRPNIAFSCTNIMLNFFYFRWTSNKSSNLSHDRQSRFSRSKNHIFFPQLPYDLCIRLASQIREKDIRLPNCKSKTKTDKSLVQNKLSFFFLIKSTIWASPSILPLIGFKKHKLSTFSHLLFFLFLFCEVYMRLNKTIVIYSL